MSNEDRSIIAYFSKVPSNCLQVLSQDSLEVLRSVPLETMQLTAICSCYKQDHFYTGSTQGQVHQWDPATLEINQEMKIHTPEIIRLVQFGDFLVVGTNWDNVSIWNTVTCQPQHLIKCDGQVLNMY